MIENTTPHNTDKTYGLMEIVKGTSPLVEKEPEDTVFTFPNLVLVEFICFTILFSVLSIISLIFNAPLEELANPTRTPNPAKAPWYFLGLQELVSHSAFIGGVLLPTLFVLGLMSIPYIDKNSNRKPKDRKMAIVLFAIFVILNVVFIVIGTYFRGPNWDFVFPWSHTPTR